MAELPHAPGLLDPVPARRLREAMARAGYSPAILRGLGWIGSPGWRNTMRGRISTMPTPECGVLAKFFMIGDPVPVELLVPALDGAEVLSALEGAGLAARQADGMVTCPYQLSPVGDLLIVSDVIGDPASMDPPEDFIISVSGASRGVDDLTVREPCELAVDVGCGQGYLCLRSLSHAKRAIATDISPRALAFARANAAIQGMTDRIEFLQGSFYEPLADCAGRVDLLCCNPPFVMQPGSKVTSAVSAAEGDGMIEDLARGLPRLLRENGWGTLIGLWENTDARDWSSRVRAWVEGAGCDALIFQFQTYGVGEYLTSWFPPDIRARIEPGWRALCERRKIAAVTHGAVVMRKRSGPNWVATLSTPLFARSGPGSDQVKAFFSSQTAIHSMWGPMDLLDRKLRHAGGWRFDPAQGQPKAAPAGAARGLGLPLPAAARWEPILASFDGTEAAKETLSKLRQAGAIIVAPDRPETAEMMLGLVNAGALDIVS